MSLPGDTMAAIAAPAAFLAPDDLGRQNNKRIDYERGGIALNDGSQGLLVQNWRARLVGDNVMIGPDPFTSETLLLTDTGITELSLSFDQNMRPVLAYVAAGQAKLHWYNSSTETQVTTTLAADVRSPFVTMDDKRAVATLLASNDVVLFYVRGSTLFARYQRDQYSVERTMTMAVGSGSTIAKAGMSDGLTVQVEMRAA